MYDVIVFWSVGPPRYYRALYDYDPFYHSPNEEDVEEELGFKAGDIITVSCCVRVLCHLLILVCDY